jgi:hypothetical protein
MKLVIKHGDELATTSEIIAQNTDNEHRAVLQLIGTYKEQMESFGRVAFEMRTLKTKGGDQQREIAILNEQQSTFLLTLMRNTEIVVRFKVELVKEFYRMRSDGLVVAKHAPAKLFPDYFRVAKLIGCDRNSAAISANQAVFKKTGENVLALLGYQAMEAERQEIVFNVSDLVDGISGVRMNKMLEAAGLQHNENGRWVPDDKGEHSRVMDTGKRHGDGTPVQQVKWSRSVLSSLKIEEAA